MHPVKGMAFLAVALFAMFWFVGLFGAGSLVDIFEVGVFRPGFTLPEPGSQLRQHPLSSTPAAR